MNKKIFLLLSLVLAVGVYADSQTQTEQNSTEQEQTAQPAGRILSEPQAKPAKLVSVSTDTSWRIAQQKKEAASGSQTSSDGVKTSDEKSQESAQQAE